jgi:hypothetical protein
MSLSLPWSKTRQSARKQVSGLREKLARTADQTSHAAEQAAEYAKRGADELRRQAPGLGRQAADVGRQAAEVSQHAATLAAERAREAATELRSLQLARRRDVAWRPRLTLLAGLASGLAAMFFLDPQHGPRRRALARDKILAWSNDVTRVVRDRAKDLSNRTVGVMHEARSSLGDATESMAADEVGFGGPLSEEPEALIDRDTEEPIRSGAGL